MKQCIYYDVCFSVLYVGHNFIMPDGKVISDNCACYRSELADSLGLSYPKPITFNLKDLDVTY